MEFFADGKLNFVLIDLDGDGFGTRDTCTGKGTFWGDDEIKILSSGEVIWPWDR